MGNNINYGNNYGIIGDTVNNTMNNYGTINNRCTFNWQQLEQEMYFLDRWAANMPPEMYQNYGELCQSVRNRDEGRLARVLKAIGRHALDFVKQLGLQVLPSLILAAL